MRLHGVGGRRGCGFISQGGSRELSAMTNDVTSDVSALSMELGSDLAALYEGWQGSGAEERVETTVAWIARLHAAFYGRELARVPSRFQHVEQVLADAFARLDGGGADWSAFYSFVAGVLVRLATNDCVASSCHDGSAKKKKSKGKAQPTSPLAFLVVNALKALGERQGQDKHRELCRLQGETNEELRSFCVGGLGSGPAVVSPLIEHWTQSVVSSSDMVTMSATGPKAAGRAARTLPHHRLRLLTG
jgi:hypothetical protein